MKILKFWANWCSPCKVQGELLKNFNIVPVESIDIEKAANQDLVIKYDIRNLPTLIVVDSSGKELKRFSGVTTLEKLEEEVKNI